MHIFVSYTTRDKHLNAKRLQDIHDVICQFGNTYIDLLHNNSEDRQARVEKELSKSSIIIFIITPATSESLWFLKEKRLAYQLQKDCIEISIDKSVIWNDSLKHIETTLKNKLSANNVIGSLKENRHVERTPQMFHFVSSCRPKRGR